MSETDSEQPQTLDPITLDLGNGYKAVVTIKSISDIVENDDGTGNINVDHEYEITDGDGNNVEDDLTTEQAQDIEHYVGEAIEYLVISSIESQLRETDSDDVLTESQHIEKIKDENGEFYWGITESNDSE